MIDSPLCWVGGKFLLREQILSYAPKHKVYVEVFGGAAWVLFGKKPSPVEIYNDFNSELVNFFRVVKYQKQELIDNFQWELNSREIFNEYKNADLTKLSKVERAKIFMYVVKNGFGCHYPATTFSWNKDRLYLRLDRIDEIITAAYSRLLKVIIENLDFEKVITSYDSPDAWFFLDPPYYKIKKYQHNFKEEDWDRLVRCLSEVKGKWLMTVNDAPELRKMFQDWYIKSVVSRYSISVQDSNITGHQLFIANYDITKFKKVKRRIIN